MMNNKGLTLIEILVSIALIAIILVFIFTLLADLKNEDYLSSSKGIDGLNRTEVIHLIENDFIERNLSRMEQNNCGNDLCLTFYFADGGSKSLKVYEKYIVYDNERWTLESGNFIVANTHYCKLSNFNESGYYLFELSIPMTHDAQSHRKFSIDLTHVSTHDIVIPDALIIRGVQVGTVC